ncbi:MAG: nucleoside deaminase [Burkholderiales bacterium]|nr:nucleoside deaminase [Burkholderiales bacterium]
MTADPRFLTMAIELARNNVVDHGGRPFGAVLVKDGQVLATGVNEILATHDPSTHAELQAIREAAIKQRNPRLEGCVMYASSHPCPMCLSAIHMTGIREVYYAYSNEDGAAYGLSTANVYAEMAKPVAQQSIHVEYVPVRLEGESPFACWMRVKPA